MVMKSNSKPQIEQEELDDELNPEYLFNGTANRLLVLIVRGKIDPVALARETLTGRGVVTEDRMDYWENWTPDE